MTVEQLRQRAEIAVERMRFLGEAYTESVAVEGRTLLALLDIAEAMKEVMWLHPHQPYCERVDCVCPAAVIQARAALSRLDTEGGQ